MKKLTYISTLLVVLFSATFTAQAQEKILISRLPGSASLSDNFYYYSPYYKYITSSAGQDTMMVDKNTKSVLSSYPWLRTTLKDGIITLSFDENPEEIRRISDISITQSDGTERIVHIIQRATTALGGLAYGNGNNKILAISSGGGMSRFEVESDAVAVTSSRPWLRASIKNNIVTVEFDDNFGDSQRGAEVVISKSDGTSRTINAVQQGMYLPYKYREDMRIFNWAINADASYLFNPSSSPLNMFFNEYLFYNSWRSRFFIPTDEALGVYYDLATSRFQQPRMLSFYYSTRLQNRAAPVKARAYRWDPVTNEVGTTVPGTISASIINNRLKDLLNSHIVSHPDLDAGPGFNSLNQYYITKGGSPIKISNTADGLLTGDFNPASTNFYVQGGFQIDNDSLINIKQAYDFRGETTGTYDGDGLMYAIDRPIQTTTKSVYSVFSEQYEASPFYEFFILCQFDSHLANLVGLADNVDSDMIEEELEKYATFTSSMNGLTYYSINFFDRLNYTVYVPTNEAIKKAYSQGLPSWQQVADTYSARELEVQEATAAGRTEAEIQEIIQNYNAKAQAMIICIVNFVRNHFQENSVFADHDAIAPTMYTTACIDNETGKNNSLQVSSTGNGTLFVQPVYGTSSEGAVLGTQCAVVDDRSRKNIFAREYVLSTDAYNATNAMIEKSKHAVIHQIDDVLNFKELQNGRYDSDWATTEAAKQFIEKYRIAE